MFGWSHHYYEMEIHLLNLFNLIPRATEFSSDSPAPCLRLPCRYTSNGIWCPWGHVFLLFLFCISRNRDPLWAVLRKSEDPAVFIACPGSWFRILTSKARENQVSFSGLFQDSYSFAVRLFLFAWEEVRREKFQVYINVDVHIVGSPNSTPKARNIGKARFLLSDHFHPYRISVRSNHLSRLLINWRMCNACWEPCSIHAILYLRAAQQPEKNSLVSLVF